MSEDARELSSEELDHIQRSTKKKKEGDGDAGDLVFSEDIHDLCPVEENGAVDIQTDPTPRISYKNTILWVSDGHVHGEESEPTWLEDEEEDGSDMEDTIEQDSKPRISFSKEDRQRFRGPWKKTLIVKLLGKSIGQGLLFEKAKRLWKISGDFESIDLGHGFYLIKFDLTHDCSQVLTGGPWMIFDHYLIVQRWRPKFQPSIALIPSTAMWVRLPGLPMKYYNEEALLAIGKLIGKTIRIDQNTLLATRARYARLCIEIDLQKPLVSRVIVDNITLVIEYEGIHAICFQCGKIGHKIGDCQAMNLQGERTQEPAMAKSGEIQDTKSEDPYGLG